MGETGLPRGDGRFKGEGKLRGEGGSGERKYGEIGDVGGEFKIDYYPTIEIRLFDFFLKLYFFFVIWDLWNIGENYGDRIFI